MSATKASSLRSLPSIDQLLRTAVAARLRDSLGLQHLTAIARKVTDEMRTELQTQGSNDHSKETLLEEAARRLAVLG